MKPTSVTATATKPVATATETLTLIPTFNFTATVPMPATVTADPTLTETPTITLTRTAILSRTPTATFNPWGIRTRTPAPAAACPQTTPGLLEIPNFFDRRYRSSDEERVVLGYLNSNGPGNLIEAQKKLGPSDPNAPVFAYLDLTNDGVPEIVLGITGFYIFGCKDGSYQTLFRLPPDGLLFPPGISLAPDANRDGVPEFILQTTRDKLGGHGYKIYEWNGQEFSSLLVPEPPEYYEDGEISLLAPDGKIDFRDLNGDGIKELVVTDGIPIGTVFHDGLPWRIETRVYQWNGSQFIFTRRSFSPPQYRFQAAQDADRAVLAGDYAAALDLYQEVIYNTGLDWWTADRKKYLQQAFLGFSQDQPTPTPPPPDPNEIRDLSAYARYRMVLLYAMRNKQADAQIVYDSLVKLNQAGRGGFAYVEMASIFWKEYLNSHNLAKACTLAADYAAAHPNEVLATVGGDFHGWQDRVYMPDDICPFK